MKTPTKKINKYALNIFATVKDFEKFLQNVYGKSDEYIKAMGFYPSIDNVAIDDILYTMEEYDMDGQYIDLYNKRTDTMIEIETSNRYKNGWSDAKVWLFEKYGAYRNDINFLD